MVTVQLELEAQLEVVNVVTSDGIDLCFLTSCLECRGGPGLESCYSTYGRS